MKYTYLFIKKKSEKRQNFTNSPRKPISYQFKIAGMLVVPKLYFFPLLTIQPPLQPDYTLRSTNWFYIIICLHFEGYMMRTEVYPERC